MEQAATDPDLAVELLRLERALASRDGSGVDGGLESLLADDFLEFGSSGRRWDRQATIASLHPTVTSEPLEFSAFTARSLGPDTALVTYELAIPAGDGLRRTFRSSIWHRRAGRWQMVFHQGTPIAEPPR